MPNRLEADLKELMQAAQPLTLAVAESLTCGHVQARVGRISGASTFFLGGVTAYTVEQKVRLLRVDRAAAVRSDGVSAEVARQMARGACALFESDLAVATTGYAELPPVDKDSAPFAWWALAHRFADGTWAERHGRVVCPGRPPRVEVQAMVADAVVAELTNYLIELRR